MTPQRIGEPDLDHPNGDSNVHRRRANPAARANLRGRPYPGRAHLSGANPGASVVPRGEAGVGKTEIARALAAGLDTELIRLQCYEGLDINHAVYEWNHARQLLEIRLMEAGGNLDRETAAASPL